MCKGILPACMSVKHAGAWYSWRPKGGPGFLGVRVTNGCEPPNGSWELKVGPLKRNHCS